MKKKTGFTLVEVIVIVVLVGILTTLASGGYNWAVEKARGNEAKEVLLKVYAGYQRLKADGDPDPQLNSTSTTSTVNINWNKLGMNDLNSNTLYPNRYFNYTCYSSCKNIFRMDAIRRTDSSKYIYIILDDGSFEKSVPY